MRRPFIVLFGALIVAVTLAVSLAAQQPRITNARLTTQAAGSPFPQTFRAIVSAQTDVTWIGYTVPVFNRQQVMCCFVSATGSGFMSGNIVMSDASGWVPAVCGIEPNDKERR